MKKQTPFLLVSFKQHTDKMACKAIRPDLGFCRNYAMEGTDFCHCHRNMVREVVEERWKERYLEQRVWFSLWHKPSLDKCMSYLLEPFVFLTKEDILKMPYPTSKLVPLYREMVRHKICEPMDNPFLFGRAVEMYVDWVQLPLHTWRTSQMEKLEALFQTNEHSILCFITFLMCVLQRQRYPDEDVEDLFPKLLRLVDCDAGREFAMGCPELNGFPEVLQKYELPDCFTEFLKGAFTEEIVKLRKEAFFIKKSRMNIVKEELMAKTWHPDRIWKYLEMGYEMDDE